MRSPEDEGEGGAPRRSLLRPLDEVPPEETERGLRALRVHGVAIMAMVALQGGPFLSAFLYELGATNAEIGLLTTIAFLSQLTQVPGLMLLQRFPNRKLIVAGSALAYRASWLLLAAVPLLGFEREVPVILGILLVSELLSAISGPSWNSWLRDAVPDAIRGAVMSRRMALGTMASLTVTLLGGWAVDTWKAAHPGQSLLGYSGLFVLGVGLGFLGLGALLRVPERRMPASEGVGIVTLLKRPLADRNFRNLIHFAASWTLAVSVASPFFVVYLLRRLEMPLATVTQLTVVSQVANLLFLGIWGRLGDRFANKSVLALSCPLFLLSVLAWTFTTMPGPHALTLPLLVGIYLLSGLAMAGVSVASTNIALELSPHGDAAAYLTTHGLACAATGTVGPLLGGYLADLFASNEVSLVLTWRRGELAGAIPAIDYQGLDFVFLGALVLGFYALHRLSLVKEEGEVTEGELRAGFLAELAGPLRGFAPLPGMKTLLLAPVALLDRVRRR